MKKIGLLPVLLLTVSSTAYAQHIDHIPGKLVIDAKDNLNKEELDELAKDYGFSHVEQSALFSSTKEEIVDVDEDKIPALVERLSKDSRVEIAEPLITYYASMTPNDPRFKEQWGMKRVKAEKAWDYATGRGVTVAVIDTGVACYDGNGFHKVTDLQETKCTKGWNFIGKNDNAADDHGHGTHVAGTIAQSTNNGVGVAGLAFNATIMPVKVLSGSGSGDNVGVADGIRWAADNGAQVINMSLGGMRSEIIDKAVLHAISKNVTVVAAAGNSSGPVEYPGGSEGVIGVSAIDETDALAKFSCRGKGIDLAAPGINILQQTICEGGKNKCEEYKSFSGTSMASPHVAGAATLVASLGVTKPEAVEKYLRDSADKVDTSENGKSLYGSGILNAGEAVKKVTTNHIFYRMLSFLGLTMLVSFLARKVNSKALSPWNWKFLTAGLVAGPGLLCFAPLVLSRSELAVDLVATPLADMDLLFLGQSVHRWLPLATAFLPALLTVMFYGHKTLRTVTAGLSVGTAAYLVSTMYLNEVASPFGYATTMLWLGFNALLCLWVGRENLVKPEKSTV